MIKKSKHPLYKYYLKFVKPFKKQPNKFDMRQFFGVFLYDFLPNMKNYCSIDRLLKNVNVLQVRTVTNPTTPLYSKKKVKLFWTKKNIKTTKREHAFKDFPSTCNVEILIPLTLNYNIIKCSIKNKLNKLLLDLREFKLFQKSKDKIKYDYFNSSLKTEIVIN